MKEGTASYNAWVETPIPVYTKFYFFDMLNPSDLFYKHEKPILEERGPYTFRFVHFKVYGCLISIYNKSTFAGKPRRR